TRRPEAHHRARGGAGRRPHRSGPALGLGPLHEAGPPRPHVTEHPGGDRLSLKGARGQDSPAARARSTAGPMALARAATSAAVEVWPTEKRRVPRARSGSVPVASRTWLGWATPAVQAEPVEQAMPWASRSSSSESPSQPGKVKWALAGS